MPTNYKRFRDIARAMGENVDGLSDVSAAERALEAAIRLSKDLGIPANFSSTPDYTKSRMGHSKYAERGARRSPATTRTLTASPSICSATDLLPVMPAR